MLLKVAFDGRTIADHFPGIGRYSFGLAQALAAITDMTLLIDPGASNTRHPLEDLPAQQLAVRAKSTSLASQWRVPRAVGRSGAQVYHSPHYLLPYGVPRPTVVTLFDPIPLMPEAQYSAAARLTYWLAHWLAARKARRVIVLSQWARASLSSRLNLLPAQVSVIAPGVNPAFHPRPAAEVAALKSRLNLPLEYILYVGAQRLHKNLPRLIEAYRRLPATAPPLVLAGPLDPRFPQAQAMAEQAGVSSRVHFTGAVAEADLPALYSGATLFVMPSLAEGFGLPVLEAMACGLPVACSTAPGLDEAAGQAAARFDPYNAEAIASTLDLLLSDPGRREAMRAASLAHASTFTWERAALATLAVYQQAMGI